ncbi:MAG: tripartite tricarboxylate transporter substrate-binding protein, partial [Burkholderiales bacterium]
MPTRRNWKVFLLPPFVFLHFCALAAPVLAQDPSTLRQAQDSGRAYPSRPIRMIVPYPPGGSTDPTGRAFAAWLSEALGQQVVVDNRPGAGATIGHGLVAKAAPDGYTLIINSNAHVVNPSMFAKLPYDTLKDFTDIMPLVGQPNVMVVNPGSRMKSFRDFLAEARANPGKINFAFAGLGSGTHLNSEKLKLDAKVDFTLVSYKGSADAITDVVGGRVDTSFSPISAGLP